MKRLAAPGLSLVPLRSPAAEPTTDLGAEQGVYDEDGVRIPR
jgi:hypothetical protein